MKNSWFLTPRAVPNPKLQVFCFPYAGGSSSTFANWEQSFPADVELVLVQPPGRQSRLFEKKHHSMDELIRAMSPYFHQAVKSNFVFFGHSLGSYTAFELMHNLSLENGPMPEHLIVSASRSPHPDFAREEVYDLPDGEFIEYLRALGGTPEGVLDNQELLELYLPTLRADFQVADTYRVCDDRIFDVPASVLNGDADIAITDESLLDWGRFFRSQPERLTVSGGHFYVDEQKSDVVDYLKTVVSHYMAIEAC